jgi:hypothetical protein
VGGAGNGNPVRRLVVKVSALSYGVTLAALDVIFGMALNFYPDIPYSPISDFISDGISKNISLIRISQDSRVDVCRLVRSLEK